MKNRVFYLVDVFAEEKYSGNQLAVIKGADGSGVPSYDIVISNDSKNK